MGAVHLDVIDPDRSLGFWRDLVGLTFVQERDAAVELGTHEKTLLVLHPGATRPRQQGFSGLYHLAIHLPDEPEFARVLRRLRVARCRISPTDHVMSKAIYLNDPDRIMLEFTLETPERVGEYEWDSGGGRPVIIDRDGRAREGAEPLDVEQVLSTLQDDVFSSPLPSGTKVGHVHLHVDDLEKASGFYADKIGFIQNMYAPSWQMADLYAGGRFPHRVALNTWQGVGAPQPPAGTAGLRHFTIAYDSTERLETAVSRLEQVERREDGYVTHDPAGNTVLLEA